MSIIALRIVQRIGGAVIMLAVYAPIIYFGIVMWRSALLQ
jgi:hypothetical protein